MTRGGDGPRREVASYGSYAEAQGAVDRLSGGGFPVEHVSIAAEGLRFEERATARTDYDKTALGGTVSGAPVGALLGFAFGLYGPVETFVSDLALALWGLVFGALIGAVGAVFGVVSHALMHGRRNLPVGTLRADPCDARVCPPPADSARRAAGPSRPLVS